MTSPSRPALFASSLKTSERSLVPSWTQSYEWLEKKCDLASFTILESQRKASAQLGLSEMNQVGASHLLGLDGPSCIALGIVSSIDMLTCGSGKRSCLFGCGGPFGCWHGIGSCRWLFFCWGALAGRVDGGDGGDHPNKMW